MFAYCSEIISRFVGVERLNSRFNAVGYIRNGLVFRKLNVAYSRFGLERFLDNGCYGVVQRSGTYSDIFERFVELVYYVVNLKRKRCVF